MKEKKTHAKTKKPPMFDFTPLKSRGLRVMMVASAAGALGIYAPVFYLVDRILWHFSVFSNVLHF